MRYRIRASKGKSFVVLQIDNSESKFNNIAEFYQKQYNDKGRSFMNPG